MFNKKCVVVLCFLLIIVSACTIFYLRSDNADIQKEKKLSIFINELPEIDFSGHTKLDLYSFNSVWYINKKRYEVVENTSFSPYDETIHWRINLSLLQPCGYSNDYLVYSYSGNCQRDVLVVRQNERLLLLVSSDVLNPGKYSFEDFSIINFSQIENYDVLEKIWQEHLSKEYNIAYLVYEDKPNEVVLNLIKYPELQYSVSYIEHLDHFYSRLPYEYDQSER